MQLVPFVLGIPPLCAVLFALTLPFALLRQRLPGRRGREGAPPSGQGDGGKPSWREIAGSFLALAPGHEPPAWRLLLPLFFIAGLTIAGAAQPQSGTPPTPGLVGIAVSSFLPPFILLSALPSSLRSSPSESSSPFRTLVEGLRYGGAAILLSLPVAYLCQLALEPLGLAEEQPLVQWLAAGSLSPAAVVIAAIGVIVVAPFAEELFFRATLLPALSRRGSRPLRAVLLSSLVFAALHGSLLAIAPLFVASLLFSAAYLATRRLAVAVVAHSVFNLYGLTAIYLA